MTEVQRNGNRLKIPWALAISVGISIATAGIAWGVLEARAAGRGGVFYLICWHGPVRAQFWLIVTLTRTRHLRIRVGDKQCMPKYRDGIPESDTLAKAGSWTPGQFSPWRAG